MYDIFLLVFFDHLEQLSLILLVYVVSPELFAGAIIKCKVSTQGPEMLLVNFCCIWHCIAEVLPDFYLIYFFERVTNQNVNTNITPFFPVLSAYEKNQLTKYVFFEESRWTKELDNNFVVVTVLADLYVFERLLHDLLIAKLSACNFSDEALSYIYSHLTKCKQCGCMNNTYVQVAEGIYPLYSNNLPFFALPLLKNI